ISCVLIGYVYWDTVRLIGWVVLKGVWIACLVSAGTWLLASTGGDAGFAGKLALSAIIPGAIFGWILYGEVALGLFRERSVSANGSARHVIKSHLDS
ncbi:MAG: hypothetical protein O7G86_03465, partial [Gammaproteobacteria bacterium]|nr:hypothetical protein [Gammaproteobacteria bacterium]